MRKRLFWIALVTLLIFSMLNVNMMGISVAQVVHDVAVISVTPSLTSVKLGEFVNVTVVVENQGTENETFNVTVYYDTTTIETQTNITLVADANTSLTFVWNTTDVRDEIYATEYKEKKYTIKATASTVPGETDTEDNTLVSPSKVKIISQYIAVIPQSTVDPTLTPGMTYTVSIYTDYNGSDVWGYVFSLSYNPSVLNGVEVTNGDLIVGGTATFMEGDFDNVAGELSRTGAFFFFMDPDPAPLTSGPGTLATVTFIIVGEGDSYITIGTEPVASSKLIGYTEGGYGEEYDIIDFCEPAFGHILHGYFRNTAEPVTHDIAVISVTPSNTWILKGELVNITVVVENQGTENENVTVTVYFDFVAHGWRIGMRNVQNLAAGANRTLNFTWDTTDVWVGIRTIIAVASTVHGETDTDDNMLQSDEMITVYVHTVYIRVDGSVDPPIAPISTVDNTTYTLTDNTDYRIVVERDNIVVDGAGYTMRALGLGSGDGISLLGRNNVTIKNVTIKAFDCAICLDYSSNNSISGNNITNNEEGITLDYSSNNTVSGNNIRANNMRGMQLYKSFNNTISGNNVTANQWDGMQLYKSFNNTISGNNVTANHEAGIGVDFYSAHNSISGNNIANNGYGIRLYGSSNNSISGNDITNNVFGIWLFESSNNTIYHDNFINNTQQIYDESIEYSWASLSINTWDNGYPSGGNYWSDYEERYPDAEELDDSGIWDTPYFINDYNQDNYPLMNPWTPTPPTIVATANVVPNTLNLKSKGKWITCYIELPEGYNVSDIDIYTIRLNNTFPVSLLPNPPVPAPTEIGDYDNDGVPDLMVKFNRTTLTSHIYHTLAIEYGNVTLTITGNLTDGTTFEGKDTIKVMFGGDADLNGLVELPDFYIWRENFGTTTPPQPSN